MEFSCTHSSAGQQRTIGNAYWGGFWFLVKKKKNYKSYRDESLYYLLRAQSRHCGQISDRSVPNFRRKSLRKKPHGVNHIRSAAATLRPAVAGGVNDRKNAAEIFKWHLLMSKSEAVARRVMTYLVFYFLSPRPWPKFRTDRSEIWPRCVDWARRR